MTMSRTIKLYKLPDQTVTLGFRKMEPHDVPAVTRLFRNYLKQFAVAPDFDKNDVEHWLLPKEGVIDSFLVESPETHEIIILCGSITCLLWIGILKFLQHMKIGQSSEMVQEGAATKD